MQSKTTRRVWLLDLALAGIMILPGCHGGDRAAQSSRAGVVPVDTSLALGAALDESGSQNTQARGDAFVLLDAVLDEAVPPNTMVSVWAFAAPGEARKIWGNPVRDASDLTELEDTFRNLPPGGPGTHVTPLLKAFLQSARQAQKEGRPIAFLLLTDGEWNDYDKAQPVATALAQMPNVRAILVGSLPIRGYGRTHVEAALSAFGPQRFIAFNTSEAEAALTRFRAACRQP